MSCNTNCNCGQAPCRCRAFKGTTVKRAHISTCTDCDPCESCESMVKICSFVVDSVEEGQVFHNSFIYNKADDAVYYISDDGTPTRFGASPMFIENFNPAERQIPRQIVFDIPNSRAYAFAPDGTYMTFTGIEGGYIYGDYDAEDKNLTLKLGVN